MSTVKLHWISGSPNCWRVLLVLAFKGIEFQSQRIDSATWNNQDENFLKLNPRGKVPVLENGDTVIYESIAIMSYLEAEYSGTAIFGDDPAQSGLIWQRIAELIHYTQEPIYDLSRLLMHETALNDIDYSKQLARDISKELNTINSQLSNASHLAGNELSAADIYFYPVIAFLEKMLNQSVVDQLSIDFYPIADKLPELARWMGEVEKMPGFEQAYPPHWRDE